MVKPSESVRRAQAVKQAAHHARDEAKAAAADVSAKRDAVIDAQGKSADAHGRLSEALAESERAGMKAALAKSAKDPNADKAQAEADAASRAVDKARAEADAAGKAADKADADLQAAEKVAADKTAHAEDLRDDEAAADRTLAAAAAAEERESQRDHPDVSTDKELDLDASDAGTVRAAAVAARDAMEKGYEANATTIAKARDDAAVERYDKEQAAKSAQMQVKHEQNVVNDMRSKADRLTREADAVEAKGDHALAMSLRENARRAGTDQRIAEARLEAAQQRVDTNLAASKEAGQRVEQLEQQSKDLASQRSEAEKAVDGLEERARLLEEAQHKLTQADQTGDENLRKEAEALVERAERVHVDQPSIDVVTTPVQPVTPPQAAAPVAGPEGSEDNEPAPAPSGGDAQAAVHADDLVGDTEPAATADHVATSDQGTPADAGDEVGQGGEEFTPTGSAAEPDDHAGGDVAPTAPAEFVAQVDNEEPFEPEPAAAMAPAPEHEEFVDENVDGQLA